MFPASVRLDVEGPDPLGPLLGFLGDELAEVGRRTLKDRCAQVGKSCLDLGIGEGGIDFVVELVDDLGRRVLGNADTCQPLALCPNPGRSNAITRYFFAAKSSKPLD
jgi:hypothetical protein